MPHAFADAFRYEAWANLELLDFGERQWGALPGEDARFFARILNHTHVVDRIFIGHLTGESHGFGFRRRPHRGDPHRGDANHCCTQDGNGASGRLVDRIHRTRDRR